MFNFRDLFQWERFITPSIIKIFYWLAVGIAVLFCLSGIISEFVLIMFRINEHLGAIRQRGGQM